MATPLVRIPQVQGGTMYAFASAAKDLTRAFNNPDLKFEFSKFALLDLPDFTAAVNGSNTIDFELNLLQASGASYVPTQPNVDFAQTFQNYALNLEELLLKDDDYDPIILQTDAEKIFFKWLNTLGALRIRQADSNESVLGAYAEESDSDQAGTVYNRVVKYLGSIDAENDVAYAGNTYHEVYINVPTAVGNTPVVLFNPSNYNTTGTKLYATQYIQGRAGQQHPDPNINIETVVDSYTSAEGPYYNINENTTVSIGIDWNAQSYAGVVNNSSTKSLLDYAKTGQQFTFNAILVYYDLYSQSNPSNRATNLYGILILDEIQSVGGSGSKIHEQIKYKPNEITGLNGNAFSLKLNMKFNSSLDNVGVETSVNDFTTFSMDLFMDVTTALENATELMLQANARYSNLAQRLGDMEGMVLSTQNGNQLESRVAALEQEFQNASIQLGSSTALLDLITKAHDKINSLIDGTIPAELQYNIDVIFPGRGTAVDKTLDNKIKIHNTVEGYSLSTKFLWNIAGSTVVNQITPGNLFDAGQAGSGTSQYGIWTKLMQYSNRLSLSQTFSSDPNADLNIYIDDSSVAWKAGQVFKIAFDTINIGGHNIIIKTGKATGFDKIVATIQPSQLVSNKPYIEVTCISPVNYQFEADILR
jgi:hypothetical protein